MEIRAKTTFGRYEIDSRLAQGGMAEVWLARSQGIDGFQKRVVLKTILPDLAGNPNFVKMFINEALLAAQLNHPYIVQIFDLGQVGGTYFIAMEHVHGRTLRQIQRACHKKGKVIPPWFVLRVFERVAEGLAYAYDFCNDDGTRLELVHRDVTPENIMVSLRGGVKILDFGVAKASAAAFQTKSGSLKGKYAYISPEQIKGAAADHRGDIYAVGVGLYELLTGHAPFRGKNELELLRNVLEAKPKPPREVVPSIPKDLETIVLRAIAADPAHRYSHAAELGDEIHKFLLRAPDFHGQRDLGLFTTALFASDPDVRAASPLGPSNSQRPGPAPADGPAQPSGVPTLAAKKSAPGSGAAARAKGGDSSAEDDVIEIDFELVEPIDDPAAATLTEDQAQKSQRSGPSALVLTGLEEFGLVSTEQPAPVVVNGQPEPGAATAAASAPAVDASEGPGKNGGNLSWVGRLFGRKPAPDDPAAAAISTAPEAAPAAHIGAQSDNPPLTTPTSQPSISLSTLARPRTSPKLAAYSTGETAVSKSGEAPQPAIPATGLTPRTSPSIAIARPTTRPKIARPADDNSEPTAAEPAAPAKPPAPVSDEKIASLWTPAPKRPIPDSDASSAAVATQTTPPRPSEEPAAKTLTSNKFDAFSVRRPSYENSDDVFSSIKPRHLHNRSRESPFFEKGEKARPKKESQPAEPAPADRDPWTRLRDRAGSVRPQTEAEQAAERFERGLAHMKAGELSEAQKLWEEATRLAPDNRQYFSNLKRLQKKIKDEETGSRR